eukprot:m.45367 g.45367  ORF g.45367 m.45367 type:complete len:578 (-) comp6642_c0_seq2:83-1816(-)
MAFFTGCGGGGGGPGRRRLGTKGGAAMEDSGNGNGTTDPIVSDEPTMMDQRVSDEPTVHSARRWLVVLASWLQHFVILGTLYSSGLYILPMSRAFDTGRGVAAWVGSLWYGVTIFTSVPASLLTDRTGLRWLSFLCAVVLGVGLVASAEALQLWQLYVFAVIVGLGLSCIANASIMVQPWFPTNRGRATGVAMTGSGAGNFVYALVVQAIITQYDDGGCDPDNGGDTTADGVTCNGWRWALRWEAVFSFVLCAIASLLAARPEGATTPLVRTLRRLTLGGGHEDKAPRLDQGVSMSATGAGEANQTHGDADADVADTSTSTTNHSDTMVSRVSHESGEQKQQQRRIRVSTQDLVATRCFKAMAIYWFFAGFGYLNMFSHFAAHAEDVGVSKWDAALLLSLMGLSSVCGRLVLGVAADRFRRLHVLAATCFVLAVTAAVWPAAKSFGSLVVIALLYGFFAGGVPSLPPTVVADYYGKHFSKRIFILYSMSFVCQLPGTMVGPPICGWIYDDAGNYVGAGIFSAVALAISGITVLTVPSVAEHDKTIAALVAKATGDTESRDTPARHAALALVNSTIEV